jgi:hypothetical protein
LVAGPPEFLGRTASCTVFNRMRNGKSTAVVGDPIGKLLPAQADPDAEEFLADAAPDLLKPGLHPIGTIMMCAFGREALYNCRKTPGSDGGHLLER